jgi:hypothetical protein
MSIHPVSDDLRRFGSLGLYHLTVDPAIVVSRAVDADPAFGVELECRGGQSSLPMPAVYCRRQRTGVPIRPVFVSQARQQHGMPNSVEQAIIAI